MSVITWVGLGRMGLPMASLLVNAGHEVRGVEINPALAASAAAEGVAMVTSAAEAVADANAVFTMLPTGDHVRGLLSGPDGLFARSAVDTLFIDSSTIGVESAKELHDLAVASDRRFVDAPVSGGVLKAAAGTLVFMVGGRDEDYALASGFIEPLSSRTFHTGGPGMGQAAKIVNNMIAAVCLAGTSEGVLLAERLGLDATVFYDIATRSTADNFPLREWYPVPGIVATAPSSHEYAPGFTGALLLKDLSLALQAGMTTDTDLNTAHTVHTLLSSLVERGGGDYDCSALFPSISGRLPEEQNPVNKC